MERTIRRETGKDIKIDGWLEVDCEIEEVWPIRRAVEIATIRTTYQWIDNRNISLSVYNNN